MVRAPAPAPPAPTAAAQTPFFVIDGRSHPVCATSPCPGALAYNADWSQNVAGVPYYDDVDGSIIGDRHGLPQGDEVDYWDGGVERRFAVITSTTTVDQGPTGRPAGTAMELGGIDDATACPNGSCTGPYDYTVVYLAPLD